VIEELGADPYAERRLARARVWIEAEALRDQLLGSVLFTNPAWKILLEVYTAHLEGREVSVATVCTQVNVSIPTMRRWIAVLISMNLLREFDLDTEPSRVELDLTDAATTTMDELFDRLSPS
jgi:hypothetical protein